MEIDGAHKLEHVMEKRDCRNTGYLDVHGRGGEHRRIGGLPDWCEFDIILNVSEFIPFPIPGSSYSI